MTHDPRPFIAGTPYQDGTTEVTVGRDRDGDTVIQATFGNVFSETVIPMTRRAALELRNQLDAALHSPSLPSRADLEAFLVDQRGYGHDVVESLTEPELLADYEAEGGPSLLDNQHYRERWER